MRPLVSENFTNDAATAAGRFPGNGDSVTGSSANSSALAINYDAASQSYSVSTGSRLQIFGAAQFDAAQSSATLDVYSRTSGNLTESLSLTKPGTSGALTYQYVGSGFWQRAAQNGALVDFTFDAFTYGVETPDAAVPRTGTAGYAVDLIGARAWGGAMAMTGTGALNVDFATGNIVSNGRLTSYTSDTNQPYSTVDYSASAALAASANRFNGSFRFTDFQNFNGGWNGRFYGPEAQEVGASWYVTSPDGQVATGTMMGRKSGTVATNLSLVNLTADQQFGFPSIAEKFYRTGTDGKLTELYSGGIYHVGAMSLDYTASNRGFTLRHPSFSPMTFLPSDKVSAESNASETVYRINPSDGYVYRLTLFNSGTGNTALPLTYVSFGNFQRDQTPSAYALNRYFVWGFPTTNLQMPRTGSANYNGIIRGTAVATGQEVYRLSGTSRFAANFQTGQLTGTLSPVGTSLTSALTQNFGDFQLVNGMILTQEIRADFSNALGGTGSIRGLFFGPDAAELGAIFYGRSSSAPDAWILDGAIVAGKAP